MLTEERPKTALRLLRDDAPTPAPLPMLSTRHPERQPIQIYRNCVRTHELGNGVMQVFAYNDKGTITEEWRGPDHKAMARAQAMAADLDCAVQSSPLSLVRL